MIINRRRGQVIIEMVFVTVLLISVLSGFLGLIRLIESRLSVTESLRFGTRLSMLLPNQNALVEQAVRSHFSGRGKLDFKIRRYDNTAAARFYHLNELTVSAHELPFSLIIHERVVIQPPQED